MDNKEVLFTIDEMKQDEWYPLIDFRLTDLEKHVDLEDLDNADFLGCITALSIAQRVHGLKNHTYQIAKHESTIELRCLECGPAEEPVLGKLRLLQ